MRSYHGLKCRLHDGITRKHAASQRNQPDTLFTKNNHYMKGKLISDHWLQIPTKNNAWVYAVPLGASDSGRFRRRNQNQNQSASTGFKQLQRLQSGFSRNQHGNKTPVIGLFSQSKRCSIHSHIVFDKCRKELYPKTTLIPCWCRFSRIVYPVGSAVKPHVSG